MFDVLWMSTMYFIGMLLPNAFVAHQPARRFHCSVCELPAPAPYLNGPVPTCFERWPVLPVVISVALYFDQTCFGTIAIEYRLKSHSW